MRKKIILLAFALVLGFNISSAYANENTFIICIDPGHQAKGDSKTEPIAPGSSSRKARVSSGTAGVGTKKPEYEVNLQASLILKQLLLEKGYQVVMTRETNDVNISNLERAEFANDKGANMAIRIHCDSIGNSGKTGATVLIPAKQSPYTKGIYERSKQYGEMLKNSLENSHIKVNCVVERADMTGFNWSKVPVVILEMGFMSNWNEDRMLSSPDYQRKIMEAVVTALDEYRQTVQK